MILMEEIWRACSHYPHTRIVKVKNILSRQNFNAEVKFLSRHIFFNVEVMMSSVLILRGVDLYIYIFLCISSTSRYHYQYTVLALFLFPLPIS